MTLSCHTPRRRSIQYAAADRFHLKRLCNTGSSACADDDSENYSRGAMRPKFCISLALRKSEGAGKTGCALHPRSHAHVQQTKTRMSIQEQRRTPGLPCAMALRIIRGRPGDRLCLSPRKRHQQRGPRPSRLHRTQPQRSSSLPSRPPLPGPYDQTIMMRPSCGPGCANLSH